VTVVDAWPPEATLRVVKGDPFAFRVVLRDEAGEPVDVSVWEWRATVVTGFGLRLDFETAADETGVRLWLRGDDTARISTLTRSRFDVAARQPSAGEGVTVLAGDVLAKARVTDPIRHNPDEIPGLEPGMVPA
jgi:hypothetical protein